MAETEQEKSLSEVVVKELVEQGMDSPMRDSILEAVEESEGAGAGGSRSLPLAGALVGLGAAVGFLVGRESAEMEEMPLEDVQEPEIIEDITEETEESDETESETEPEVEEPESSSRLGRALLALGILAGIAVLRRRFASGEDEEWEPIEEFEPATDLGEDEEEEAEAEEEEEEAEEAEAGEETEE